MITIKLSDIIKDTYTNANGYVLYTLIEKNMKNDGKICLSFKDMPPMSSSFYNSSIGELIENYGFNEIRDKLSFSDLTKPQLLILKKFLKNSQLYA